ncbi:MAG: ABC transporter permease, partial [Bryobacteraceae bacterium]
MRFSFLLFHRLILRPLWREPVRTALTALAIALGVGVVVAIDLAGQAAAGSFHSSLESLTGKSDLAITGTGGIDEQLLGRLVQLPYPFDFAPRIEDFASIEGKGEAFPFIGIDVIGHGTSTGGLEESGDTNQPFSNDAIWVGRRLGLRPGDHVRLLINDTLRSFTVAGVIKSTGELGEDNVIVADIGLAQEVTGKAGKLDAIDVTVPSRGTVDGWRNIIGQHLPAFIRVEPQGSRTEENRKMLSAFRWNLHVLSYIALLVGGFLIYNTVSISVVRRRNEIGIVRALGATRAAVTTGFLSEALFFAVTGTLIGLLLGRIMAIGAVRLIGSTVQSLYVSSVPAPVHLTFSAALTGIALGLGVSLFAAFAPALEASLVSPTEAMARGREQYVAAVRSRRTISWAVGILLVGGVLTQLGPVGGKPLFAYVSVLLLIAGTCLTIPNLINSFASVAYRSIQALFGVEALLALRALRASLARTSVLTAALATAVAMTASVGIMVGSFRETVWLWMDNQLKADFYLRPAGSSSADRYPTMKADIADRIERLEGVASVDRFRGYP